MIVYCIKMIMTPCYKFVIYVLVQIVKGVYHYTPSYALFYNLCSSLRPFTFLSHSKQICSINIFPQLWALSSIVFNVMCGEMWEYCVINWFILTQTSNWMSRFWGILLFNHSCCLHRINDWEGRKIQIGIIRANKSMYAVLYCWIILTIKILL